jgi:hypothetical protein
LDSIDVGYGMPATIEFANLNILKHERSLSIWRLRIALLRAFGLRLHTSIRRRIYGITRGHGGVKRNNCLLGYSIGHRISPHLGTASEASIISLGRQSVLMCEPVHILGEISMQANIGLQPNRAPVARDPGAVSISNRPLSPSGAAEPGILVRIKWLMTSGTKARF